MNFVNSSLNCSLLKAEKTLRAKIDAHHLFFNLKQPKTYELHDASLIWVIVQEPMDYIHLNQRIFIASLKIILPNFYLKPGELKFKNLWLVLVF